MILNGALNVSANLPNAGYDFSLNTNGSLNILGSSFNVSS
jgi:hypothetical protein